MTAASTTPRGLQQAVADWLRRMVGEGNVAELRALEVPPQRYGAPATEAGYFDDMDAMAKAGLELSARGAQGVYFTVQQIKPALHARSANKTQRLKNTTSDNDVLAYRWLPVDVDPVRPAGISSTDAERDEALAVAVRVREGLVAEGWPEPIGMDSGNGFHLYWRVDLPNTPESVRLVEAVLKMLARRFDTDRAKVDTTTFNPSRIMKVAGTMARKGDSTPDRPHRQCRPLKLPGRAGRGAV